MSQMSWRKQLKPKQSQVISWLYPALIIIVICLSLGIKTTHINSYFGYHLRVILSDSMSPKMKSGSLLISKDVSMADVQLGDVIVAEIDQVYVTHRVVELITSNQGKRITTKGDNNQFVDGFKVSSDTLKEKAMFNIPYLGQGLLKLQTPRGKVAGLALIIFVYLLDYLFKLLRDERKGQIEE